MEFDNPNFIDQCIMAVLCSGGHAYWIDLLWWNRRG